ncbi:hypothetical protein KKB44_01670 [Candidatus Micrarchaeota archaeon]|nr:hypothetical protein [Candidatus Micrarchaeota archaeon]
MVFIKNREDNFRKYLEKHFKLVLSDDIALFYTKGVRVGNPDIRQSRITGELGYAACDFGFNPTNSFIQNFGHLAKRNIVKLKDKEAKDFAAGMDIKMDLGKKNKHVIVTYNGYTLGLGHYETNKKKIINKIPEKRRREILNEI